MNDQVVEAAGAHVYLEPRAAAYLEDKVLDAEVDSEGKAHFSLGLQGPAQVQYLRVHDREQFGTHSAQNCSRSWTGPGAPGPSCGARTAWGTMIFWR